MSLELSAFLIVFLTAFSITLLLTPIMSILGRKWGITSKAGGRRTTEGDLRGVSKMGGVAVFFGFTIAVIIAQWLPIPRFDPAEIIRVTGLLLGGTFLFIIAALDDIFEFNAVQLGIGQIFAAAIAVLFQIFIETFNNPFTGQQADGWSHLVTVTLTMFWLGLMMNTTNFMDGLDGLATGVAFIAGAMLFIHSTFILFQTSVGLLPLAMMGSTLAFLLYNTYPAQLFLGGGAYFLGYLLGTLSIIGGAKMATILLVMGLPLMDLAWQATNRIRQGRNPMQGDRGHIHFRLLDMGFSQRQIVYAYYLFCACFGILTLITTSQMFKFIAFSVMMLLIIIGFIILSRYSSAQGDSSTSS